MDRTSQFQEWRNELLRVGRIVQDDDETTSPEQAEASFNRYIEMLDQLSGKEGFDYAVAVLEPIQSVHDYGAYQTAQNAALRFGRKAYSRALLSQLPRLIDELPDWAGDCLVIIANSQERDPVFVEIFNAELGTAATPINEVVTSFIAANEKRGWFQNRRGVLGSAA